MCIQMEAESRAQSLSPSVYSTISKVLVTRMNEFLLTMPAALIAYLFSPRYRGFLLTSTDGFTKDWEKIITEAWKSVLQYIGVTVDEEMKNRMYRILETYCVNGFSLDSQHPAFRQLNGNTDTSYWDNVRMWCKNSGDKDITPYFVIACIAVRALLAPGTSSRLESAFSIMKLLSNSTRANMSYDRVVSEFIIREANNRFGVKTLIRNVLPAKDQSSVQHSMLLSLMTSSMYFLKNLLIVILMEMMNRMR